MMKYIFNLVPSKSLKQKTINKIKFSKKLSVKYLGNMNEYNLENETITPVLYTTNNIAISINCDIEFDKLNNFINNILFPFDLYCENCKKKIKKSIYLNNYYNCSLFNNIEKIKKYKYVINIDDITDIEIFRYGFFESCLSLLMNMKTSFINVGKNKYDFVDYKPWLKPEFINGQISVEDLFYNSDIKISKINIFETSLVADYLLNIDYKDDNNMYLMMKTLFLKSQFPLKVINNFESDNYIKKDIYSMYSNSYDKLYRKIKSYDTITFDIFDTLITRKLVNPDDLFKLIDDKIKFKLDRPFIEIRKEAEIVARTEFDRDVSIDDIYITMEKINNYSSAKVKKLKKLELDLEMEVLIPRDDMVKLYNKLIKDKKNIDIISDMYLPKKVIIKILKNCGIEVYRNLFISCDINKRKDNGVMWDYYFSENNEKTIHVGDNYISDYVEVLKRGKQAIKILSGSDFYRDSYNSKISSASNSLVLGNLYNRYLLNSPFFDKNKFNNNLELYGKYLLAPIFSTFFKWFEQNNFSKNILFISREGYYLQKIYKEYCKIFNCNEINNKYFLTSRRAVSYAYCKTNKDLLELLDMEFHGTISDLFIKRYGFVLEYENNTIINLPNDKDIISEIVLSNSKELLKNAAIERREYLNYINKDFSKIINNSPCIIDLGYSGTTQYYLSKLLNKKIDGYYFALTNNLKPKKCGCDILGCFNVNKTKIDIKNLFYTKALVMESFLSAPEGQLIKFYNGSPVFNDSTFNIGKKDLLDEIYDGIIKGFKLIKKEELNFSIESINEHYRFVCNFIKNSNDKLEKVFYLDDDFCTNGKKVNKMI